VVLRVREGDELLGVAVLAAHAQKTVFHAAAPVRLERVPHVVRQRSARSFAQGGELRRREA
jgi:hypothetical protein